MHCIEGLRTSFILLHLVRELVYSTHLTEEVIVFRLNERIVAQRSMKFVRGLEQHVEVLLLVRFQRLRANHPLDHIFKYHL